MESATSQMSVTGLDSICLVVFPLVRSGMTGYCRVRIGSDCIWLVLSDFIRNVGLVWYVPVCSGPLRIEFASLNPLCAVLLDKLAEITLVPSYC